MHIFLFHFLSTCINSPAERICLFVLWPWCGRLGDSDPARQPSPHRGEQGCELQHCSARNAGRPHFQVREGGLVQQGDLLLELQQGQECAFEVSRKWGRGAKDGGDNFLQSLLAIFLLIFLFLIMNCNHYKLWLFISYYAPLFHF